MRSALATLAQAANSGRLGAELGRTVLGWQALATAGGDTAAVELGGDLHLVVVDVLAVGEAARELAARVLRAITHGVGTAIDGSDIPVRCDSVCIHSDTPNALDIARAVRAALT